MTAQRCVRRPHATFTTCTCDACAPLRHRASKLSRCGALPPRRSAEAWAIVDARLAAGWSPLAIASAAGIPDRTIHGALTTRTTWTRVTAEKIISSAPWPTAGYLPAVGATRRLRALAAAGWAHADLVERTGLPMMTLSTVRSGTKQSVHASTHAAIRAAFTALEMSIGPSRKAAEAARRAGWAPPLAWDEDTIDDPSATPDMGLPDSTPQDVVDDTVIARVLTGTPSRTTKPERAQIVPVLAARGLTDGQIAALCRTTDRTIQRTRARLDVPSRWGTAA